MLKIYFIVRIQKYSMNTFYKSNIIMLMKLEINRYMFCYYIVLDMSMCILITEVPM